jgi:hypothetical protein
MEALFDFLRRSRFEKKFKGFTQIIAGGFDPCRLGLRCPIRGTRKHIHCPRVRSRQSVSLILPCCLLQSNSEYISAVANAANCKTPHNLQAENGGSDLPSRAWVIDRHRESLRSDLSSLQQDQKYYKQRARKKENILFGVDPPFSLSALGPSRP